MQLTESQAIALDKIANWDRRGQFVLKGPAGSGKSTIMRQALEILGSRVTLVAPTGKAAVRLTETTGRQATTLHSVIYNVWKSQGELRCALREDAWIGGVAIVDEASMVTDRMARDLQSAFSGVMYIGDPFQLPPVRANDWLGAQDADVELTEVMRQALDSPILALITAIRQGKPVPVKCESDELVIKQVTSLGELTSVDQVICATNASRQMLNERIRIKKGLQGAVAIGDKLINLRNVEVSDKYVCNGAQLIVRDLLGQRAEVELDDGTKLLVRLVYSEQEFETKKGNSTLFVDMGQAITAHKAQGSQWSSVLVYDDSRYMPPAERRRWIYTALSRAVNKLIWINKN